MWWWMSGYAFDGAARGVFEGRLTLTCEQLDEQGTKPCSRRVLASEKEKPGTLPMDTGYTSENAERLLLDYSPWDRVALKRLIWAIRHGSRGRRL